MFHDAIGMPVVGADFPSARAAARRAAIALCRPGDVLHLRRERQPVGGHRAVGVYTAGGDQIGYVHPPMADGVAAAVAVARAVFQDAQPFGAVIMVTLDGTTPTLLEPRPRPRKRQPEPEPIDQFCDVFPNGPLLDH